MQSRRLMQHSSTILKCFIVSSVYTLASRMSAEGRSVLDGTRRVCFRHSRKLVFLVWQSKDLKHVFDTDSDSAVGCNCFLLRVTRHEPGL